MSFRVNKIFVALFVGIAATVVNSSKFLAIPYSSNSHYFAMKKISKELAERGHEVVMLGFQSKQKETKIHPNVNIVTCAQTDAIGLHEDLAAELLRSKKSIMQTLSLVEELNTKLCDCIFTDNELIDQFKSCDVMINDISLLCASAIHDLLKIPRVVFYSGLVPPTLHSWMHGIPMPLSYIPNMGTGFSNRMNLLQRAGNVVSFSIVSVYLYLYATGVGNKIKARYNITPEKGYWESDCDSDLVLMQTDFVINYARPLPPAAVTIGPLSPEPAKPLADELENFMNSPEGVVVVSFGSEAEAAILGSDIMDKMNTAFGHLKQKVLWKLKDMPTISVAKNIKVLQWIPQNDVLGHVNTKLFITHLGHNGMFEAAYHGIPMVGTPLLWDQFDNGAMMEAAGLGIVVEIRSITADELLTAIERVLYEPSFRANATRVSKLLKDRKRTPVQEAADHLEYVLRHNGTKHLRPAVLDIPWYQYFLLDIMIFLVTIVAVVLIFFISVGRWVVGLCCKKVKTD
ncbi:2-hydroxyacylsphingosine 1-beta-galactosyltransferase [Exaiptasia diaphana]|uniref:Glucuronosyltransferase n=1 Tax=Exaiptasia diaphana TaxID=2652724 RepID=A0A913XFZ6_EXADI|nr:2-hydroxyacylsphingosine 1-beta-galactosyltransferase [Exaiptasia diaphana]